MTSYANGFDAGTNGATITTANSGGSGDSLSVTSTNATAIYDTTRSAHGLQSAKIATSATAVSVTFVKVYAAQVSAAAFRLYVYMTANPGTSYPVVTLRNSAGVFQSSLVITTAGLLRLQNSAGTSQGITVNALPLNTWVRIEGQITTFSTTVGDGSIAFYSGDSTTATEVMPFSAKNTGTAVDRIGFGMQANASNFGPIWMDQLAWNDTGAAIGPANGALTVTLNDSTGLTGAPAPTVTWDRSASDDAGSADAVAPSVTWARLLTADPAGLNDATAPAVQYVTNRTDPAGLTDDSTASAGYVLTLADSALADDAAGAVAAFLTSLTDAAGSGDDAAPAAEFAALLDDPIGSGDGATAAANFAAHLADSTGSADVVGLAASVVRLLADDTGTADLATPIADLARSFVDSAGAADALLTVAARRALLTDIAGVTDDATVAAGFVRVLIDALDLTGDPELAVATVLLLADVAGLTDERVGGHGNVARGGALAPPSIAPASVAVAPPAAGALRGAVAIRLARLAAAARAGGSLRAEPRRGGTLSPGGDDS